MHGLGSAASGAAFGLANKNAWALAPRMRIGRRTNFWIESCLCVGLASRFLEPLECAGILLGQKGASLLLELLTGNDFNEWLVRHYSHKMGNAYDEARDVVAVRYVLTECEDTEFRKANRRIAAADSLAATLKLYEQSGIMYWENHAPFGETTFLAIAAGSGRLPQRHIPMADYSNETKAREKMAKIYAQNGQMPQALPDHGDFFRELNAAHMASAQAF
jgi:hypothetical protein